MRNRDPKRCSSLKGRGNPLCPVCGRVVHANSCADKAHGKLNPETQCAYQEDADCLAHSRAESSRFEGTEKRG